MFNNTVRKPFFIADTNALTDRGEGCLPASFKRGILSEGDFVQGDFVRFPYSYIALLS